jgi:hypothetical protein
MDVEFAQPILHLDQRTQKLPCSRQVTGEHTSTPCQHVRKTLGNTSLKLGPLPQQISSAHVTLHQCLSGPLPTLTVRPAIRALKACQAVRFVRLCQQPLPLEAHELT